MYRPVQALLARSRDRGLGSYLIVVTGVMFLTTAGPLAVVGVPSRIALFVGVFLAVATGLLVLERGPV